MPILWIPRRLCVSIAAGLNARALSAAVSTASAASAFAGLCAGLMHEQRSGGVLLRSQLRRCRGQPDRLQCWREAEMPILWIPRRFSVSITIKLDATFALAFSAALPATIAACFTASVRARHMHEQRSRRMFFRSQLRRCWCRSDRLQCWREAEVSILWLSRGPFLSKFGLSSGGGFAREDVGHAHFVDLDKKFRDKRAFDYLLRGRWIVCACFYLRAF